MSLKKWSVVAFTLLAVACAALFLVWPRDNGKDNPPEVALPERVPIIEEPEVPEPEPAEPEPLFDPEDKDGDGLSDEYELIFNLSINESGDEDQDGLLDNRERRRGSLSSTGDDDKDGLPDRWEMMWFGHLDQGPHDNPDGDDKTNIQELLWGYSIWDPLDPLPPVKLDPHPPLNQGEVRSRRSPDGKAWRNKSYYEFLLKRGYVTIPWDELDDSVYQFRPNRRLPQSWYPKPAGSRNTNK